MVKPAKREKSPKDSGNIVVDLGEEVGKNLDRRIDRKLAAAGVNLERKQEKMAGPGEGRFGGYKPGGYKPGMFGGYRPWYADKAGAGMSGSESYVSKWRNLMRPHLGKMAAGALVGALANVALVRVTPDFVKTDLGLVHSGLAFVAGLIPVLVRPNSYTLGAAVPGTAVLAVSMFNYALDGIGVKKPALRGGAVPARSLDTVAQAKAKLNDVHSKIQNPGIARVHAQAVS